MESKHRTVFYKVLTAALATGLSLLQQELCNEGLRFIMGHFIVDNLITDWESMEWARHTNQRALFPNNDFDKVYNRG
jgi:hypothetical protein